MKTISINEWPVYILSVALLFAFSACEKYTPVYNYDETEEITVTGLQPVYQATSGVDVLSIDPQVSSNKAGDLQYVWSMYETTYTTKTDTLARTKKLEYPVNRSAKNYNLILRVTNTQTGYAQYFKSTVQVGTPYTRGWYVPKDDGSQTDMDFFNTLTGSIVPDNSNKIEDVYSLVNGKKLNGKAMMTAFFMSYNSTIDGVSAFRRTLSLVSERDVAMMELSSLQTVRDFNTIFQVPPATRNVGMIAMDGAASYFLINDGQLYALRAYTSMGMFGGRKVLTSQDKPYHLSKYHSMPLPGGSATFFFDETSGAFYNSTGNTTFLTPITANGVASMMAGPSIAPASAALTNKKLVYMGTKNSASSGGGAPSAYAIFQDKATSVKTMFQVMGQGPTGVGLMMGVTIAPTDKLYNATNYGLLIGDENFLYFSVEKEVWSRNLSVPVAAASERLQFTVPNDEEITFIRHRKLTGADAYNYVMIGTQAGQNYKIRIFTKTAGNLNATPVVVLEGKGRPVDALFVGPTVSVGNDMTYAFTY